MSETNLLQEHYRWMFQGELHLASATDRTGRFCEVSAGLLQLLGYTREEFLAMSPQELATEETLEALKSEYLPRLRILGQLENVPIEYRCSDASTKKLIANTGVYLTDDSQEFLSVSYYQEVDSWDNISHEFKAFYLATPAMLHTLDVYSHVIEVSDRWLHKMGYKRKEVIGRYIGDFYTESVREHLKDGSLTHINYADDYTNHERQMVTKSGEILDVLVSAAKVKNRAGQTLRHQVAIKDVTDRNKAQAELQKAFNENAKLRRDLELERDYLRENVRVSMNDGEIVGNSPALQSMLARIEAVAFTSANVLIIGESGTGKELVSHAIHSRSLRKDEALVTVNCASIPSELFESEFFGHVKGAFTGATRDRIGRFQLANGGTIFLDEVGEIPLELQGKLLRVLEQQRFERVGDDETKEINVRIIAATNRNLAAEVAAGRFREDLFYRLNVFPIDVPPLRDRGDDVIQIATHFIADICIEFGRPALPLSERNIRQISEYSWPGNVRELRNVLERAIILSHDNRMNISLPNKAKPRKQSANTLPVNDYLNEEEMRLFVKRNLEQALATANGKISGAGGAAELLGVKPTTLTDRIHAYGVDIPSKRRGRPSN
ncbi:MAG: sigma 54-interacting transcriptional regulator [Gammaproteobacteria bacterium]